MFLVPGTGLPVAMTVPVTEAEGPGRRFAVWFQGCPLRCAGCCNPEMLPFDDRPRTSVVDLVAQIAATNEVHDLEGVSFLGGEPTVHADIARLAESVRSLGLTVMVYSGRTLEELQSARLDHLDRLLAATDLLVDGPYDATRPDRRRWIGSENQRVHALTSRYDLDDPVWHQSDTLEIRLREGVVTINGFPARSAVSFWKPARSKP